MIKKIKRLPFWVPMIPIIILISIFEPIRMASSFIVDWCLKIREKYGFALRQKFPDLVIKHGGNSEE